MFYRDYPIWFLRYRQCYAFPKPASFSFWAQAKLQFPAFPVANQNLVMKHCPAQVCPHNPVWLQGEDAAWFSLCLVAQWLHGCEYSGHCPVPCTELNWRWQFLCWPLVSKNALGLGILSWSLIYAPLTCWDVCEQEISFLLCYVTEVLELVTVQAGIHYAVSQSSLKSFLFCHNEEKRSLTKQGLAVHPA